MDEALDLSIDRLLMMMMMMCSATVKLRYWEADCLFALCNVLGVRSECCVATPFSKIITNVDEKKNYVLL